MTGNSTEDADASNPSEPEGEEPLYRPESAITMSSKEKGYAVNIHSVLEHVPIGNEDYLHVQFEEGDSPEDPPMLLYSLVDAPPKDQHTPNTRQVDGTARHKTAVVDVPAVYCNPSSLGIKKEDYTGEDPLVFQPVFEPGEPMFGLVLMGRLSELIRNPDDYQDASPLTPESHPKYWSAAELDEYTTYDPSAGAEADDGEFSVKHAQQLRQEILDGSLEESGENLPTDFIIPKPDISDTIFYRWPNRWRTVDRDELTDWNQKLPRALTETLLRRADEHPGYDPYVVERDGYRYEIHSINAGGLMRIADTIFGVPPEVASILATWHNASARQLLTEMHAARGQELPDDHRINSDKFDAIVLPMGEATKWPNSKTAINPSDRQIALHSRAIEGDVGPGDIESLLNQTAEADTAPNTTSSASEADTTDPEAADQMTMGNLSDDIDEETRLTLPESELDERFWKMRTFDTDEFLEYYNQGLDTDEMADELDVATSTVASAIDRLEEVGVEESS